MSVLTQEMMFTASNLPSCSKEQLAELNMELVRRLQRYEFGTPAYQQAVSDFHDEVSNRVRLVSIANASADSRRG